MVSHRHDSYLLTGKLSNCDDFVLDNLHDTRIQNQIDDDAKGSYQYGSTSFPGPPSSLRKETLGLRLITRLPKQGWFSK